VLEQAKKIRQEFKEDLQNIQNKDELYLKYFSKKRGVIPQLFKEIASFDQNKRREAGAVLNKLKTEIETKLKNESEIHIETTTDFTSPSPPPNIGMAHPTIQVAREMNEFFRYYGFSVVEGPEIETAEYNFRKLNLPEDHPATDLQDTLFIKEPDLLLRTHTSSVEARVLSTQKPPIRVVTPGRCYRNETPNASNAAFFWQYQGFVVDEGITIQHLKGTLEEFHKFLFGDDVKLRFRYKYYPEVSPGMGVDMLCKFCRGNGCDPCKHRGWFEILGSGMIHPTILENCGIDPEKYTGFAFGMGLDRLAMQRFGINDIRKLYEGDMIYT